MTSHSPRVTVSRLHAGQEHRQWQVAPFLPNRCEVDQARVFWPFGGQGLQVGGGRGRRSWSRGWTSSRQAAGTGRHHRNGDGNWEGTDKTNSHDGSISLHLPSFCRHTTVTTLDSVGPTLPYLTLPFGCTGTHTHKSDSATTRKINEQKSWNI